MALSANSVFEVQTGGNDTNGGGFVTGAAGTDYSLVAAKRTGTGADDSTTDAVAVGTTTITSATAVFGTTIVGNIIYLQGGTGTLAAGWYQVATRVNATTITVDRNVAAGTGITMNIGGALISLGQAGAIATVAGNRVYVKAGTYTISSASTNVSGGCWSGTATPMNIEGYQTTRGDRGTAPLLQASGISTFTIISQTGAASAVINIDTDGASLTSSRGMAVRGVVLKCRGINHTNTAFSGTTTTICVQCVATGCATQPAFTSHIAVDCIAHDNTVTGFSFAGDYIAIRCIADSNSGASSFGFTMTGNNCMVTNCIAYNNGSDGFRTLGGTILTNCIAESNGGFGVNANTSASVLFMNTATYNNTSGGVNLSTGVGVQNINPVVGSGSFFVDAPNQNFALNNTAGGGASARATGYPGVLPIGGTGYLDIGVLQHQDPASGGLMRHPGMDGGFSA